jgi:2-oxoglutarate ferredoxin oxidoreductase subunit alpha
MRLTITKALENSQKVLVPEMNIGQIAGEVRRVNQSRCEVVTLNKVDGTLITPLEILKKLEEISR